MLSELGFKLKFQITYLFPFFQPYPFVISLNGSRILIRFQMIKIIRREQNSMVVAIEDSQGISEEIVTVSF